MKQLALMLTLALVLAACGAGDGDPEASDPLEPPAGTEGGVVLEISDEGGFVPIEFNLQRVPRFTVFDDGTVVAPTGEQFTFPGPVIPPLERHTVDASAYSDVLAFVSDLGLADIDALDLNDAPNVADASTTVVRYFDATGEHRLSIYALGFETGDGRSAIVESMITTLQQAVDESSGEPYVPDRLLVYATDELITDGADPAAWPLDVAPSDMQEGILGAFRCTLVEGEAAQRAIDEIGTAKIDAVFAGDDTGYRIFVRPILPHQDPSC